MADPRLNLLNFSLTNLLGPTPADSCNSAQGIQLSASLSLNAKGANLSLGANVGAFQNLAVGGGGQVGLGLRNLASISDQVRIGGATAGLSLGLPRSSAAGQNYVLGQVGLSTSSLSGASTVNANVTGAASNQASHIFNQVSQGVFTTSMIPSAFSSFQNAVNLIGSIFTPRATTPQNTQFGQTCGASPYAEDLIKLAPKYKFLFVVQFEFAPEFQHIMSNIDPAFVIKTSTRPNVDFEFEDVNMYNFRTKIARKTIYQDMSMKFYDDDYNNAFQFYNAYLKLLSPIANVDIEKQSMDPLDAYENVGGGMGFNQPTNILQPTWGNAVGQGYAASLGPLGNSNSARNALRKITLFHVYRFGTMMNVYNFYNPKIKNLKLDDLDMTQTGDGNEVSFDFSYDSVFIIPGYRVAFDNNKYNLTSITNRGRYPFGVAPGSIANDLTPTDGIGLVNGQDIESFNDSNNPNSNFVTSIPVVNSTQLIESFIPADTAGGVTTDFSAVGDPLANGKTTTFEDLSNVTTTAERLPDPVVGVIQDSATNSNIVPEVASQIKTVPTTTHNAQTYPPFVGGGGTSSGGGASGSF